MTGTRSCDRPYAALQHYFRQPSAKSTPTMCSGVPSHWKPRHTTERQHLQSTTDSQVSSPVRENCSKLKCNLKSRTSAEAFCALSQQRETGGCELSNDHLRHTMKWMRIPSATKGWSVLTITTYGFQRWKGLIKKQCREAEMWPREGINCVNTDPQRNPTQFLTAIWTLALFPVLNFASSTTVTDLVYTWVMLLTRLCSHFFLIRCISIYFLWNIFSRELTAGVLPALIIPELVVTNQLSWKVGV